MRIIGITGGIGTGKSTVLQILENEYNAYVVEADRLAHRLMEPGGSAFSQILSTFGEGILDENGYIDRSVLGGIVFSNSERLQQLNEIVHPLVKEAIKEDIANKAQEASYDIYVIEAALLLEDGYREICDTIWYIYSAMDVRIDRLIKGRGGTREKWISVMNNQSSEAYYRLHCDAVVDNGKTLEDTKEAIAQLLNQC